MPETRDHTLLPALIISPYVFATEVRSLYILLLDSSLHSVLSYYKSFLVYSPLSRPLHMYLLLLWGNWLNPTLIMPVLLLNYCMDPKILVWFSQSLSSIHNSSTSLSLFNSPLLSPPLLHMLTPPHANTSLVILENYLLWMLNNLSLLHLNIEYYFKIRYLLLYSEKKKKRKLIQSFCKSQPHCEFMQAFPETLFMVLRCSCPCL